MIALYFFGVIVIVIFLSWAEKSFDTPTLSVALIWPIFLPLLLINYIGDSVATWAKKRELKKKKVSKNGT